MRREKNVRQFRVRGNAYLLAFDAPVIVVRRFRELRLEEHEYVLLSSEVT